jgi:arylsulfatase A-like enzyme
MHASLDIQPYFYMRGRSPVMPPTEKVAASSSTGGPEGWNGIQGAFWRAGKVAPDFKHADVTPRFVQEAVKLIRSHGTKKEGAENKDKPLFLYLALPSPHTPWLPQDEFRGQSGAGMYGDFVMQVDAAVGRVMAALDAAGMKQNTLLVFSSDNGPVWYEKDFNKFGHRAVGALRGMKFDSWEGGHRMPFVVRWPGRTAPRSVCQQTIVFSDVFATFAELVGLEQIPEGVAEDSVSFLPYLLDAAKAPEKRAPIIHDRWTVRDEDWKLILPKNKHKAKKYPSGELYNLREDLSEQHNLISEHPEMAQRQHERLSSLLSQ